MSSLARRPITLVEIDLPYCTRTYGSAPCAAVLGTTGAAKCFNSRFTCQDPANYDEGTKTITLAPNIDGLPDIPGIFPCLTSVDARPGELNLSGFDPSSTALGVRATVNIKAQDFADSDTWLDKYQSERVSGAALASGVGYQPKARGTFFGRMMARFPYYVGLPVRVRRGFVGDAPGDMPTEHYFMSEITGPDAAGVISFTAKDILDLTDSDKEVIPSASLGKLLDAIDADDTTATLTPAGIGDEDYGTSGLLRIGRELIGFTRSGDILTLTRGQDGTVADSHAALDVVQECVVIEGVGIHEAAETILKYKSTKYDAFIPTADWAAEYATWYGGMVLGRVILSKPTGKKIHIGELCQLGVMIWWEPVDQEIKFRVNAPLLPDETYVSITDENSLIVGSPNVGRAGDQRASAVWMFHGIRDWTSDSLTEDNFDKLTISTGTENLYGQAAYKKIFSRWWGRAGNDAAVSVITERLFARFRNTPNIVSGQLDVKDRSSVKLGARLLVETYSLQNVDGAILAEPMQVSYAEYTDGRVRFRAETYKLDGQFAFWMDDATAPADYDSATAAQRATGAFWADALNPSDTDSVWF